MSPLEKVNFRTFALTGRIVYACYPGRCPGLCTGCPFRAHFFKWTHKWCRRYPYPKGGYGGMFLGWIMSDNPQPYGSFGNGSAMRVSPIGWWFDSKEDVLREAGKTAACTHNHDEGIKGALWIVMHSNGFKDAVRKAVALGDDADTIGAITGSIAEALWNIPDWMKEKALQYLRDDMRCVLNDFNERLQVP